MIEICSKTNTAKTVYSADCAQTIIWDFLVKIFRPSHLKLEDRFFHNLWTISPVALGFNVKTQPLIKFWSISILADWINLNYRAPTILSLWVRNNFVIDHFWICISLVLLFEVFLVPLILYIKWLSRVKSLKQWQILMIRSPSIFI